MIIAISKNSMRVNFNFPFLFQPWLQFSLPVQHPTDFTCLLQQKIPIVRSSQTLLITVWIVNIVNETCNASKRKCKVPTREIMKTKGMGSKVQWTWYELSQVAISTHSSHLFALWLEVFPTQIIPSLVSIRQAEFQHSVVWLNMCSSRIADHTTFPIL